MSVEVRYIVDGDCDCGTPKYSWEHENGLDHYWECDYGRIPGFNIHDPAPLAVVARDWAHSVYKGGGERRIGEKLHTVTIVPVLDGSGEVTEDTYLRLFHRIDYHGLSWTWDLLPAHFADPPSKHNNAHRAIYLGRWPD